LIKKLSVLLIFFNLLVAQPDSRFEAFDWTLYRQTGQINSISEGYTYAYFATEWAGILRYNLYQNRFDEPITTAQGLSDNQINAVHFDQDTGILWAATYGFIEFSYNGQGDWFNIDLSDYGLYRNTRIVRIGSTVNFVWIDAEYVFLKLDKASGIMLGFLPQPDEQNIDWSSSNDLIFELPPKLRDYVLTGGWIYNYSQFIDPVGNFRTPTTYFFGKYNRSFIGLDDGTILLGDQQMETFSPLIFGLNNLNITAFTKDENMWVVGKNYFVTKGITKYNFNRGEFQHVDFASEINLNPRSFYSVLETNEEVWLGSDIIVAIYNKEDGYWREIGEVQGLPHGKVISMAEDSVAIWVGTTQGLCKISMISKRAEFSEIQKILGFQSINELKIVEGDLWIATDYYLLIYNQKKNKLINFKDFGNTLKIDKRKDIFNNFTALYKYNDEIYIATENGILCYNFKSKEWNVAVEPSAYAGSNVNSLIIDQNYCFIGTDQGLWQINLEGGTSQLFDFAFIGSVQDLYIQDSTLLIGSKNGLIKYLWKKNL